jgi:peptidoglycan/xylan/chitin deacetylase (PgdA/CDA1 family)
VTPTLCLKVDVCTREGMRNGVPRLLDQLKRLDAKATFCLAFGPDNSGKAIFNLLKPGFAKKMLGSGAPKLYGWRTTVSGTLLPARPIASAFPDLVRRIEAEGHEVALHAWDHRRWQDHVDEMPDAEIRAHYESAAKSYAEILGHAPRGAGAAAWIVNPRSLAIEDSLGLAWASDLRGGPPCRLRADGRVFATPQIPTTGRCIEELLTTGVPHPRTMPITRALIDALIADMMNANPAILAVHAEVEGGPYSVVLGETVARLRGEGYSVVTLGALAASLDAASLPVRDLAFKPLAGRSGRVATADG